MKTKVCKKCGVEKPLDEMVQNKGCLDGYLSYCKPCRNTLRRKEKPPKLKICPGCAQNFICVYNTNQKSYCSVKCRREYYNNLTREKDIAHYLKNKKTINQKARRRDKQKRKELWDCYIRARIRSTMGTKNPAPEIISIKRKTLKLKRLIHEKRKTIKKIAARH